MKYLKKIIENLKRLDIRKTSMKTKMRILIVLIIISIAIMIDFGVRNNTARERTLTVKNEQQIKQDKVKENSQTTITQDKSAKFDSQVKQGYDEFMNNKNYSEAVKIEDSVISQDSSNYKAYDIKGIALCYEKLTDDNFNNGMQCIDKALSIKPDYGFSVYHKALAYELYGKFDDAIKWYNKDLSIENYIWTYYGLASIYGRYGDIDNVQKYLKTAISMGPSINVDVKKLAKEEKDFDNVRDKQQFQDLIK